MAGAPSPERPVVLRRLGIIKDPNDSFLQESRLQESRAQSEAPAQDALELFATEAETAPRSERWMDAIRPHVTPSIGFLRRNPLVGVVAVSAVLAVVAIWAINQFVASDESSAPSETSVATAPGDDAVATSADSSAVPTTDARASASLPKAPTVVNAVRTGTSSVARGQQVARSRPAGANVGVARNAPAAQPPDPLSAGAPVTVPEVPAAAPAASAVAAAAVDDTIYSVEDRDVTPPQTEERLPGPTISAWTTRTNAMEVIVSQTGAVERVRMVTPPQRMPDMFVLSRAKVWMFKPAMKDGRPVRYRLVLTWEVNP